MPTTHRFEGLRVVIYPNDHRPAHVHVIGRGREAVFTLNCEVGPVELRESYRFSRREIAHIQAVLESHREELCSAWEEIHGD
jgi:hypothetical protein